MLYCIPFDSLHRKGQKCAIKHYISDIITQMMKVRNDYFTSSGALSCRQGRCGTLGETRRMTK